MFRRNLKYNVKKKLMRYEETTDILRILIEVSIEFDDKLYELIMKQRYSDSDEKVDIFIELLSYRSEERRFSERRDDDYNMTSMKINSTQRRKRKNSKRKKENSKDKTCYLCNKTNHLARNCRSKNMMYREQINATLKRKFDDWKEIERKNNASDASVSKLDSNDEYFHVETREELLEILNEKEFTETSVSTKQIN